MSGIPTRAVHSQPGRRFSLLGIGLTIETCAAILPLPSSELLDLPVESKLIFKNADIIHEKLSETADFQKQCKLLIDWLHSLVEPPAKHKLIRHACTRRWEMPTESRIREIARSLGVSERHLWRLAMCED